MPGGKDYYQTWRPHYNALVGAADDPPSTNIAGLSHSHQRPVFIRIISPAIRIVFAWLKETNGTPLTQTYDALMSPVQTQQAYHSLERPTTKCEDRCTQLSNTHPSNIVICYLWQISHVCTHPPSEKRGADDVADASQKQHYTWQYITCSKSNAGTHPHRSHKMTILGWSRVKSYFHLTLPYHLFFSLDLTLPPVFTWPHPTT